MKASSTSWYFSEMQGSWLSFFLTQGSNLHLYISCTGRWIPMQSCIKLSFDSVNGVYNISHIYNGLYSKSASILFSVCIKNLRCNWCFCLMCHNRVIHLIILEKIHTAKMRLCIIQSFIIYNYIHVAIFGIFHKICLVLILSTWLRKHLWNKVNILY